MVAYASLGGRGIQNFPAAAVVAPGEILEHMNPMGGFPEMHSGAVAAPGDGLVGGPRGEAIRNPPCESPQDTLSSIIVVM